MNEDEKYLFDLNGYLVLCEVLSHVEVNNLDTAIDSHADQMQEINQSLAADSIVMQGASRRMGWSS